MERRKLVLTVEDDVFHQSVAIIIAAQGFAVYKSNPQRIEVFERFTRVPPLESYFTSDKIVELNSKGIKVEWM